MNENDYYDTWRLRLDFSLCHPTTDCALSLWTFSEGGSNRQEWNSAFHRDMMIRDTLVLDLAHYSNLNSDQIIGFELQWQRIGGPEPQDKILKIHSVSINDRPLDVNALDYTPWFDDWYQKLHPEDKKQALRKTIRHGGNFGWYGEIAMKVARYNSYEVTGKHVPGLVNERKWF